MYYTMNAFMEIHFFITSESTNGNGADIHIHYTA